MSSVAWGDYNNNGQIDLLLTGYVYDSGEQYSIIYDNVGGNLTDIGAGLPGVYNTSCSAVAWGDYDNDGDLDILLTGVTMSGRISLIYNNTGGVFSDISAGLTGIEGSAAWGDFDNDGDLDIILAGSSTEGYISKIYRNDGGTFIDIKAGLPGVYYSSVAWGDYDNDNDLDIFLSGRTTTSELISKIYRNDIGFFTDIKASIPGVYVGTGIWGDYDNDGDLDILVGGYTGSGDIAKIYKNTSGVFSDIGAGLPGFDSGQASWGDYDNDGDLDILITGWGAEIFSKVFNNNNGVFTDISAELPPVYGSSAWGDYDNDGDLDFITTGSDNFGDFTRIYRNNSTSANTSPSAPSSLQSTITGNGVTLSWNRSTDNQTPQNALSYNVFIGTSPGTVNKKSPMANITTGYRKIVQAGTIQNNSWVIKKLPAGTYYWSVQAIDNNFSGSAFPPQGSFTVPFSSSVTPTTDQVIKINQSGAMLTVTESSSPTSRQWKYSTTYGGPYNQSFAGATGTTCIPIFPATGIYYVICESTKGGIVYISNQVRILVTDFIEQSAIILPGVQSGSTSWGDFDNDGDLDLMLAGVTLSEGNIAKLYRNNLGVFNEIIDFNPLMMGAGGYKSSAWGDYDNDGDLDLVITAYDSSRVWRNDGTFFTGRAALPGATGSSVSWGDYDNDGDLDILLTGSSPGGFPLSKIFRNDNGHFVDISAGLTEAANTTATWGDYDNDGDLDILLTGSPTKIYRNDNGFFADVAAGLPSIVNGSGSWGDYDNDGDLDILLTGSNISKIFKNTNGIFSDILTSIPGVANSSSAWGDYDNDGNLDIVLTGMASTGRIANVYRNVNGVFTEVITNLTGVNFSSVSWCDYDNNGSLDILITGNNLTEYISKIYKNNALTANTVPSVPSNLHSVIGANHVTLSWDKSTDASTPQAALTYNLYIGAPPDTVERRTPMAFIASGYRKIVQKEIQANSWVIKNLPSGTYYWSAQAIDNSYAGSPFAAVNSFTVVYSTSISPVNDQNLIINQNGNVLTVTEPTPANSRQWKYSVTSGGPYNQTISGAAETSYTPNFTNWGTYYVVCESVKDAVVYTSNEVKINVPVFTEIPSASSGLENVYRGSTAWGDYDGDGDQDMLLTGYSKYGYFSSIFNFNGVNFDLGPSLPGVQLSSASWGDYDNDGDLDILMTGYPSLSKIFRNDGGGSFIDINAGLQGLSNSSSAWGDYDNDGDLDVLITGNYYSKIYRNDSGLFTDINAGLTGVTFSSCAWGDFDGDSDLDILITGSSHAGYVSIIYRNDNGTFTDIISGLPGVGYGSVAWGDYDSDGDLDILLTGYGLVNNTVGYIAKIFRNDNGSFPDINAGLTGVRYSSASWGDYDNDGDLDIFISGFTTSGLISRVYRNDAGTFTDINAGFPGLQYGSSSWGDYDKDGDLDIIVTGQRTSGYFTALYKNNITTSNTVPSAPLGLTAIPGSNKVTLSWSKSTDSKTPQNGLSYNIYIGTSAGTINKLSPMSSLADGYRSIIQTGKIQKNNWVVKNLPMGTYYWNVQSIDNAFAGSPFGSEGSFIIPFSSSISPITPQILGLSQDGTLLTVTETEAPTSRQWKYSTTPGGPYNQTITVATNSTHIPNFITFGTFYVVCESVFGGITYTSNEVKITVPVFTKTGIVIENIRFSSVSWGDYDNDEDLDILVIGSGPSGAVTKIYNNNGGVFTDIFASLPGLNYASVSWGDYDNDNDLDILMTGYATSDITKIFRNDAGVFNDTGVTLPGAQYGSASWGDFDNDGDLDILISGSGLATVFRNVNGIFTDSGCNMGGVFNGSSAWSDFDKDGDLDILITGLSGSDPTARLYRNDNGLLTDINAGLTGVSYSSVEWGDYDNDGDPDILITGMGAYSPVSKVYRNDNGAFIDINSSLTGAYKGSAAWGDYDNDGDLDILLSGHNSSDGITQVYRNDAGVFTRINEILTGVQYSSVKWGDYDNDGDLDFLLTGNSNSSPYISEIYENNINVINSVPSAPSGLQSVPDANRVTLSWNKATDLNTPQNGLSYNLYVGALSGSGDKKSPMSAIPAGYRKIVNKGIQTNEYTLKNLTAGSYYWSVQAIDNTFAGSVFAPENSFAIDYSSSIAPASDQYLSINQNGTLLTVTESSPADSRQWKYSVNPGGPYDQSITGATGITYTPNFGSWGTYYVVCVSAENFVSYISNEVKISLPVFLEQTDINLLGISRGSVVWGDYDKDNDLDLFITGYNISSGGFISSLYNNNAGTFTDINAGFPGLQYCSAAWGDYDNDGDLDLFLSGYFANNNYFSRIYRNDSGVFSDIIAGITGVYLASAEWRDYDNDGDIDLLLSGTANATSFISRIYRNDNGLFTDINAGLAGVNQGTVSWGDYDNDGDPDILLTGYQVSGEKISIIYRNDNGAFTDINAGLPGIYLSSAGWGDYDNDGDLDILLSGQTNTSERITKIYRNTNSVFSDINAGLPGIISGSVAWGDFDNDGYLDILLTGSGQAGYISKVYRNTGVDFSDMNVNIPGTIYSSTAWGDYDNDNDLDLVLSGNNGSAYITRIYKNTGNVPNTPPLPPTDLQVSALSLSKVSLSWTRATDAQTPQNALTHNLRIGTNTGENNILPSMSDAGTGYRRIPSRGNAEFKNTGYNLKDLFPGTYYWSVQAIDQAYAGGAWATESSFTLLAGPSATEATNVLQISFNANWGSVALATGYKLDVATDALFTSFLDGYENKDAGNSLSAAVTGLTAKTKYYYRVRAYHAGGTSLIFSNTITVTTPNEVPVPTANPATSITQTGFTANWTGVAGAISYSLDIATDDAFTTFVTGYNNRDAGNATSVAVAGLTVNTTYYYRVRANGTVGSSVNSNTVPVTTLPVPPAAPAGLSAESITSEGFVLIWFSSPTAITYYLDISTVNDFTSYIAGYNDFNNGPDTTKTVTGLSPSATYYFRVRAGNTGGTGSSSATASATTKPEIPVAPLAEAAGGLGQQVFTANWSASSGATGYRLDVSFDAAFTTSVTGFDNLDVGNVINYDVPGLTAKTVYHYRVRAYNVSGTSSNSNSVTVTTLPDPPAAPSGLTAYSCNDLVTLSWTANTESDFLRYVIYGGTTANPTTRLDSTLTISGVTKTISGLTDGQTYYFRIKSVISPEVSSQYSASASVLVKKGAVPRIKSKFSGAVLICYNPDDSIVSWQWYRGETAISGATKQYYVTGGTRDNFSVVTTDIDGCINTSSAIDLTGVKALTIYPNPAEDNFTLKFSSEYKGRTLISLYNSSGVKICQYQTDKTDEELEYVIPVGYLPDGLYTVKIVINEEELAHSRVMIIN